MCNNLFDLHCHSVYSDGKNTPEEMVLAAIDLGMPRLGISDHSHVPPNLDGMSLELASEYREELFRLKKKYKDQINFICGLERDYYSDDHEFYDYIIGSVHYIKAEDGTLCSIDESYEILKSIVMNYFDCNWYKAAVSYFDTVADVVNKTNCDIIGHFDLFCKFNELKCDFDENNSIYVNAWKKAANNLLKTNKPFEINTGAIARGYKSDAYPSAIIRDYLQERGAKFILSSDAHSAKELTYKFLDYKKYIT